MIGNFRRLATCYGVGVGGAIGGRGVSVGVPSVTVSGCVAVGSDVWVGSDAGASTNTVGVSVGFGGRGEGVGVGIGVNVLVAVGATVGVGVDLRIGMINGVLLGVGSGVGESGVTVGVRVGRVVGRGVARARPVGAGLAGAGATSSEVKSPLHASSAGSDATHPV